MLSDTEWVLTWWHQGVLSACSWFSPVIYGKRPALLRSSHLEVGFTHVTWSELNLLSLCSCSDQALDSTRCTWFTYLITLFPSSWPFFSFLYLFLCCSLFPNKQSVPVMFSPLVFLVLLVFLVTWIILALQHIALSVIQVLLGVGRSYSPPAIRQVWPSCITPL